MSVELTVSLVLYQNNKSKIRRLLQSLEKSEIEYLLYVYDNSPTKNLESLFGGDQIIYHHDPRNVGFGRGHNYAFSKICKKAKYHLIVNPDIYFDNNVLKDMIYVMEQENDIGILAPKVLFPDGKLQRTARLLPRPIDFFVRRFCPFKRVIERINSRYEIHSYDYKCPIEVPFISGCFMLVRSDLFRELQGFDERFFMYTEDIDLTRRMMKRARTVLNPSVYVYHEYERGSHKNFRLLVIFLKSAILYFNKWGWFFDKDRANINNSVLKN